MQASVTGSGPAAAPSADGFHSVGTARVTARRHPGMLERLRCRLARKFMNSQHIIVLCSCPDEASAARLARALVSERLAACVNRIAAVRSTYSWAGDLQDDTEVLLLIKTLGSRYQAVEARIRELHGYEVPEIVALPIVAGSGHYLAWLARESGADPASGDDAPRANR